MVQSRILIYNLSMLKKYGFNPYEKFRDRSLTLNDYLAIDRTILSNERTLLAYGRTALAQVIIGGSAIKFFDSGAMMLLGGAFLLGAVITMALGWRSYRHTDRLLRVALESQTGGEEHPLEEKLAAADEQAKAEAEAEKQAKAKQEKTARENEKTGTGD